MQALWMLIPEEAYILIIVGAGIALMLGILNFSGAMTLIGIVCLIVIITPFISAIIDLLPNWAFLLLLLSFAFVVIKIVLGKRVTENVLSLIIFTLLMLPFKLLARIFGFGRRT